MSYQGLPSVEDPDSLLKGDIYEGLEYPQSPPPQDMTREYVTNQSNHWFNSLPELPMTDVGKGDFRQGPLTKGPMPLYYNPHAAHPPGEYNIFPPTSSPNPSTKGFSGTTPVKLGQPDETPWHIQEEAFQAFQPSPSTQGFSGMASMTPVKLGQPDETPWHIQKEALKAFQPSPLKKSGSFGGKRGKTTKRKNKKKRKTIRKRR
jgi:hypothetical protein